MKVLTMLALLASSQSTPAQTIVTSWYEMGTVTASGEKFDKRKLTAAHRSYPFGTRLKLGYGKRNVVVTVNDRGPFIKGRLLDISKAAAKALQMDGVQKVELLAVIPARKDRKRV